MSYTLRRLSWGTGPSPCCGPATAFSACCSSGRPTWAPCWLSAPPPSPSGTGVLRPPGSVPGLLPRPLSPQPAAPGRLSPLGAHLSMCAALGTAAPASPSSGAWAAGPSPFCPWALSALCFPLPMGSFEFGGVREFLRPISTTAFSTPRTVCPLSWGLSCFFVSLCALAASLCQILRRDPAKNESWFPRHPLEAGAVSCFDGLLLPSGAGLVLFLCQYSRPAGPYAYDGTVRARTARWCGCSCPAPWCPPFSQPALWPLLCFSGLALFLAGGCPPLSATIRAAGASTDAAAPPVRRAGGGAACPPPPWPLLLGAAPTAAVILLCALCYYHLTPAGHLPPEPWGGLPLGWIGGNHA